MSTKRIPEWLDRLLSFLGYHLCLALPGGWRGEPWKTIELWLLPWAGSHTYYEQKDSRQ